MPYCKFRKSDGVFIGGTMYDTVPFDDATEIVLVLPTYPDRMNDRWDGSTGTRPATSSELALVAAESIEPPSVAQKAIDEALADPTVSVSLKGVLQAVRSKV